MGQPSSLRDVVITQLVINGETIASDFAVPGVNRKTFTGLLARMTEDGDIERRRVLHKGKWCWAYLRIQGDSSRFNNEPEHIFVLRNLPRHQVFEGQA